MTVFNGEATVARALDSALAQRCAPEFEIIVADDGSADGTVKILESYGDRIRILRCLHRGIGPCRNAAIRIARGEYLAFLDADDMWLPDKLARLVEPLSRDPALMLAYSNATVFGSMTPVTRPEYWSVPKSRMRQPSARCSVASGR